MLIPILEARISSTKPALKQLPLVYTLFQVVNLIRIELKLINLDVVLSLSFVGVHYDPNFFSYVMMMKDLKAEEHLVCSVLKMQS